MASQALKDLLLDVIEKNYTRRTSHSNIGRWRMEAEAIKRFDGQPLYYIVDELVLKSSRLTSRKKAHTHKIIGSASKKNDEDTGVIRKPLDEGKPTLYGYVYLFEDVI